MKSGKSSSFQTTAIGPFSRLNLLRKTPIRTKQNSRHEVRGQQQIVFQDDGKLCLREAPKHLPAGEVDQVRDARVAAWPRNHEKLLELNISSMCKPIECLTSPAATEIYLILKYYIFFMDSVSLGIADVQTENWNFVSVEQFKI